MTDSSMPTLSLAEIRALVAAMPAEMVLCDDSCRLRFANQAARALLARVGREPAGNCRPLFGRAAGCGECPPPEHRQPVPHHSVTLEGPEGELLLKVRCQPFLGRKLLILQDVSQEISLLRQTEFERKELAAKLVLQERRQRAGAAEQRFLAELVDQLPDALLVVGEDRRIQHVNQMATAMLAARPDEPCYRLVGGERPCEDCPASEGFSAARGCKKSHEVDGQFYTEIFAGAPDGRGGVLLFRDVTRQIGLIEQIRANRRVIDEKNQTLASLAAFGTYLQKEGDVSAVVGRFFDICLPLADTRAGVVVVNDIRPGKLWLSEGRGADSEAVKRLSRACLSRTFQSSAESLLPAEALPWPVATQLSLFGANGQRVGVAVFEGRLCDEGCEALDLACEALGSYLHNQILLRQLEERANTDVLTGLYNRHYLAQALEDETTKYRRYNIPFAVVLGDINQLKMVNDLHGHETGDRLIVAAARAIRATLRQTDIAARTGGDEFVVLLTNTRHADAAHFVDRLQAEAFADLAIPLPSGEPFPVTISVGAAGVDAFPPEILIKEADRRMYEQKQRFYQRAERWR